MKEEVCYWLVCFVAPDASSGPRIFAFAEFLTALALLVVLYTTADVRYKFRLAITPGSLYSTTFGLIIFIGMGSLLSELWLAKGWWLPRTAGMSREIWQAMLGMLFLGAFLTWMYYAFLRPPIFSRRNWYKYAQTLFRFVLKGDDSELPAIADEIGRSALPLVRHASRVRPRVSHPREQGVAEESQPSKPDIEGYAHDLLLLIANRKLCRHIVRSAPNTALRFFDAMKTERTYDIPLGQFAKAISAEAIAYKDSSLYQEADGFESGLIGYLKPWTQGVYGNIELVEALGRRFGSPLDIGYEDRGAWDASQWEAYCRATLMAFESYLTSDWFGRHSTSLWRAIDNMESAFADLYKLNASSEGAYQRDEYQRLRVIVRFVRDLVGLIDKQPNVPRSPLRQREDYPLGDVYAPIANLIFEILFAASHVEGPPDLAWSIHHNATWGEFFSFSRNSNAWKVIHHRVRRLLYDEIAEISELPNYKNAAILGLLLNLVGFGITKSKHSIGRDYWPLAKAVQTIAKRHYMKLRRDLPDVADSVLIGGISFDEQNRRLVKTYAKGLEREPARHYLGVDPA